MVKYLSFIFCLFFSVLQLDVCYADYSDTYYTRFGAVTAKISCRKYSFFSSCDEEYPLRIVISNRSIKTIARVSFSLLARHPDRSTNLLLKWDGLGAVLQKPTDFYHGYTSDHIITRFDEISLCYKAPSIADHTVSIYDLVWEIKITDVVWK